MHAVKSEQMRPRNRWVGVAAGFLAISYGIGAPLTAFLEYGSQTLSQRFDLPPELIYITCGVQFVCAIGVLVRPLASWAAAALESPYSRPFDTVITPSESVGCAFDLATPSP